MKVKAKTITATQFRAGLFRILDELEPEGIIVLKRGLPVAKVVPLFRRRNQKFIGLMKGKIVINGDIFSAGAKWNAQS